MFPVAKVAKITVACLLLAAVAGVIVVAISYLPHSIQQNFQGIELHMTGEDEYEILQILDIRIDGRIRYGIFSSFPQFEGSVEVSAFDFTLDGAQLWIPFMNGFSMGGGLSYPGLTHRGNSVVARVETLGTIYTNEDFSSLVIHLVTEWTHLGGYSYMGIHGNRVIVAPATDSGIALEILRYKNFIWSEELGILYMP